jgi:hypothetical protein
MHDLKEAVGQYVIYRDFLTATAPHYNLYLAINENTYTTFFLQKAIQLIVEQNQISLIVVDLDTEEITQWIR